MNGWCPRCDALFGAMTETTSVVCRNCGRGFEIFVVRREEEPAVPEAASADAARCAHHPNNPAGKTCGRCGDYLCAVCATPVEGQILCVACFELKEEHGDLRTAQSAFRLPTFSLVLGIVSVLAGWVNCAGLVLGCTAIVLGIVSLRQISLKPALPGRGRAITGIVLGCLGVLVMFGFVALQVWIQMQAMKEKP